MSIGAPRDVAAPAGNRSRTRSPLTRRDAGRYARPRMLLFCQYANPDMYPTTVRLARLCADRGERVHIVALADSPAVIHDYGPDVSVERVAPVTGRAAGARTFTRFIGRSVVAARARRPRLVIGFDARGLLAAATAAKVAGVRFVYHLYDVREGRAVGIERAVARVERICIDAAAAMVVPSRAKAEHLARTGLQRPMIVVANSPPLEARRRTTRLRDLLAAKGVKAKTVVYHHGSTAAGKGILEAIDSMPSWPEDSVLALIGIVRPARFFEEITRRAEARGVSRRVVYLGVVPLPELFDLTCSADLGLYLPTTQDAIHTTSGEAAVKLNDYFACGVPAIVSDFPSLRQLMRETGAGVAVDPNDSTALGAEIGRLLRDDIARARLSDAAYAAHVTTYNLARQVAPLLDALPELAALRRAVAQSS